MSRLAAGQGRNQQEQGEHRPGIRHARRTLAGTLGESPPLMWRSFTAALQRTPENMYRIFASCRLPRLLPQVEMGRRAKKGESSVNEYMAEVRSLPIGAEVDKSHANHGF